MKLSYNKKNKKKEKINNFKLKYTKTNTCNSFNLITCK